jgi:hypothetical protein
MKKNKTWNIRFLVDDSFGPSSQWTNVLYSKLTDFCSVRADGRGLEALLARASIFSYQRSTLSVFMNFTSMTLVNFILKLDSNPSNPWLIAPMWNNQNLIPDSYGWQEACTVQVWTHWVLKHCSWWVHFLLATNPTQCQCYRILHQFWGKVWIGQPPPSQWVKNLGKVLE